jgi:hypothetical protein
MTMTTCHISGTEERPTYRVSRVACTNFNQTNFAPPLLFLELTDNPGNAGCLKPRDTAGRISGQAVSPYKKDTL